MKLGIIGLDSSHALAFSEMLNDRGHPHHIPGHPVTVAFPGEASPDFDMSCQRLEPFTRQVSERWGVRIAGSIQEVMEEVDAVFLEQVDGRKRMEQFREIARYQKPVFVDKPFALSSSEAAAMVELAEQLEVPVMSTSSLRYADSLTAALKEGLFGQLVGAEFATPMPRKESQPGYFWYGSHGADMLFAAMGDGCRQVTVTQTPGEDLITGIWEDGRIGCVRGSLRWDNRYCGVLYGTDCPVLVDTATDKRGYYASLLERIIDFFQSGQTPVSGREMVSVIRFLEAANESAATKKVIAL